MVGIVPLLRLGLGLGLGLQQFLKHHLRRQARPRRDHVADDDVLFQAPEVVNLGGGRRFGQDAGRLLETRGGDEGVGGQRRLGDSQEHRLGLGFLAPLDLDLTVIPLTNPKFLTIFLLGNSKAVVMLLFSIFKIRYQFIIYPFLLIFLSCLQSADAWRIIS